jgi:hypothetical protein
VFALSKRVPACVPRGVGVMNPALASTIAPDAVTDNLLLITIAVSVVVAIVGGVFGFVGGQAILAQAPGTTNVVGQLPRLKNLAWLLGGSFTFYVADPKKLPLPAKFSMTWPWIAYVLGAMVGVFAAFAMAHVAVTNSIRFYNAGRPSGQQLDVHALRSEYLLNRKERYEKRRAADEKAIAEKIAAKEEQAAAVEERRSAEFSELRRQANKLVVTHIYRTLQFLHAEPVRHDSEVLTLIGTIMDTIRAYVVAYAGGRLVGDDAKVRATFMAFIPFAKGDAELWAKRLFTGGMTGEYLGDLVLRSPATVEGDQIIVPVARDKANLLPGAPQALVTRQPKIMNIRERGFLSDSPKFAKPELSEYFKRHYFVGINSITSIPIEKGHECVGILNIETSQTMLVGANEKEAEAIVDRLQVPIALLSAFL